ncbi:MAG: flagellar basal-body rod protein FlgF [Calditrichia bacterium]
MIKGLYISKNGMMPPRKMMDILSNNLANMNTIGFKKSKAVFHELIDEASDPDKIVQQVTVFEKGALRETGNPLDLALTGEGYFVVNTPVGEVYTRNGNFTIDGEGRLVTQDGYSVMGTGGEIFLNGQDFTISDDASIMVQEQVMDHLRVVRFKNPEALEQISGAYFSDKDNAAAVELPPEEISVKTGFLEGSNVTGMAEIIEMIEIFRQFEFAQKAIQSQDQTLEKLINDAGRVL